MSFIDEGDNTENFLQKAAVCSLSLSPHVRGLMFVGNWSHAHFSIRRQKETEAREGKGETNERTLPTYLLKDPSN